jgi:hypothetical protein
MSVCFLHQDVLASPTERAKMLGVEKCLGQVGIESGRRKREVAEALGKSLVKVPIRNIG